jgi:hypothetical protein
MRAAHRTNTRSASRPRYHRHRHHHSIVLDHHPHHHHWIVTILHSVTTAHFDRFRQHCRSGLGIEEHHGQSITRTGSSRSYSIVAIITTRWSPSSLDHHHHHHSIITTRSSLDHHHHHHSMVAIPTRSSPPPPLDHHHPIIAAADFDRFRQHLRDLNSFLDNRYELEIDERLEFVRMLSQLVS